MSFKKKAGTAVLAITAACAVAVPGVAFAAVTYDSDAEVFTTVDGADTMATINLDASTAAATVVGGTALTSVAINTAGLGTQNVVVTLPDGYAGAVYFATDNANNANVTAVQDTSGTAVPITAFAEATYDNTVGSTTTSGDASLNASANSVTVNMKTDAYVDLSAGTSLTYININSDMVTLASSTIVLPANYTGIVVFSGMNSMVDVMSGTQSYTATTTTDALAFANGNKIGTLVNDATNGLTFTITDNTVAEDDIDDFLDRSVASRLKVMSITDNDYEDLDFNRCSGVTSLTVSGNDLTDIDGLDDIGTGNGTVTVSITASDLDSLDFGSNSSILAATINTDLTSLDLSDLDKMTSLDVSGCSDLESLELDGADSLTTLNISNTQLPTLDTSDTKIDTIAASAGALGLYAGAYIKLDDQYATVEENDDDDDYDDYTFSLDNITNGNGEDVISDSDSDFTVDFDSTVDKPTNYIDFDDGDLIITADDAPNSVIFKNQVDSSDNPGVYYNIKFGVKEEGDRIAGADRYDTMHEINTNQGDDDFDTVFKNADDEKPEDVVIASGEDYADALTASALAGALDTGIVTTSLDSLTDDSIDMLDDMDDQGTAYVVGGTKAISYSVEQQLSDLGFNIKRMAGVDRYETSIKVQDVIQDLIDSSSTTTTVNKKTAIIASGVNYADALAIAPYAYTQNIPIILVGSDGELNDETADLFNKYKKDYSRVIIVGGTSVVSSNIEDTMDGYDIDTIRLAGSNRYETNMVINEWLDRGSSSISSSSSVFSNAGYTKSEISDLNDEEVRATGDANDYDGNAYIVTGNGFADALAVAPLAGVMGGTVNMISASNMDTVIEAKDNDVPKTIIVGGTAVISEDMADEIDDID